MNTSVRMLHALFWILAIVKAVDILTTVILVDRTNGHMTESNPLMRYILVEYGVTVLASVKALIILGVIAILNVIYPTFDYKKDGLRGKQVTILSICGIILFLLFAVLANLIRILLYP